MSGTICSSALNLRPCLPLALISGLFWPRRKFIRYQDKIVIKILPVIALG